MLYGIDVSFYQGVVDFKAVAESGIQFATAQLTFGTEAYMLDNEMQRVQWADSMCPKLYESPIPIVGGYHWLLPGRIEEQVDYFIKRMNALFGGVYGRICQLDVEWNSRLSMGPSYDDALTFAKIFESKTQGAQLSLYYPYWYWFDTGQGDLTAFPNTTLWQANYRDELLESKFISYGGKDVKLVQYTSSGRTPGVNTLCDRNAYIGTYEALWDDLTGNGVKTACTS